MTETLAPRLLKGVQADYVEAQWEGKNTSGFVAFGINVLIQIDVCSATTAGGILLPEDQAWKMTQASETGCIVHMGEDAFQHYDSGKPWLGEKPRVGDRVHFPRYSGSIMSAGRDGNEYRIMDFRLIDAGLDKSEEA